MFIKGISPGFNIQRVIIIPYKILIKNLVLGFVIDGLGLILSRSGFLTLLLLFELIGF